MIEHQRNCEKSGRYVEAEMAKKRVLELKNKDDSKKKDHIKNKHANEVKKKYFKKISSSKITKF